MSENGLICEIDQLCGGLYTGIEDGVHVMKTMWEFLKEEDKMVLLLIDARNTFNKRNFTRMLWVIWRF